MKALAEDDWHERRARHEARVRAWIEPRLARAARHERHPVEDFLFEYYAYRPAKLLRWHPGIGFLLQGETARAYLSCRDYQETHHGVTLGLSKISPPRISSIRWIHAMLRRTEHRPAAFGCFGLHEWAMVYRAGSIRHSAWPLRLTPAEIVEVVESLRLRCTHYDAFRFFTPEARPLNKYQPTRDTTSAFEQPGCLHTNMDLYKWAFKLAPFTPSELVADCFELASRIRALDMRASPYELRALGYSPIRVETPEGRLEYENLQRNFARSASPLRQRLQAICEAIIERWIACTSDSAPIPRPCAVPCLSQQTSAAGPRSISPRFATTQGWCARGSARDLQFLPW
jgi:hypothetical protein